MPPLRTQTLRSGGVSPSLGWRGAGRSWNLPVDKLTRASPSKRPASRTGLALRLDRLRRGSRPHGHIQSHNLRKVPSERDRCHAPLSAKTDVNQGRCNLSERPWSGSRDTAGHPAAGCRGSPTVRPAQRAAFGWRASSGPCGLRNPSRRGSRGEVSLSRIFQIVQRGERVINLSEESCFNVQKLNLGSAVEKQENRCSKGAPLAAGAGGAGGRAANTSRQVA